MRADMPTEATSRPTATRSSPDPALSTSIDFAALRACLAEAGYTLVRSYRTDGTVGYVVGRWGLLRELADLDEVERFAHQAGGAAA